MCLQLLLRCIFYARLQTSKHEQQFCSEIEKCCSGGADVEGVRRMDARSSVLGGAEVAARTLGRMRASVFGAY